MHKHAKDYTAKRNVRPGFNLYIHVYRYMFYGKNI